MSEHRKSHRTHDKDDADSDKAEKKAEPAETESSSIVTSRPIMKKPAAGESTADESAADDAGDKPADRPTLATSDKVKLQPLAGSELPDRTEAKDSTPPLKPEESASDISQPAPTAQDNEAAPWKEAAPADKDTTDDTQKSPADTAGDVPKNPADTTDDPGKNPRAKQAEAEAAEQAKRDEAIQKLVDSRQYFLPISTVQKQKTKQFIMLGAGLSLVLILFWLDVALDAGIVRIGGLHAPTHFFSN